MMYAQLCLHHTQGGPTPQLFLGCQTLVCLHVLLCGVRVLYNRQHFAVCCSLLACGSGVQF